MAARTFNDIYGGEFLNHVAMPMGGIGSGMICLEGSGALSHVSVRHAPDVFNEPFQFAALCIKGEANVARVLEGPVPTRKVFGAAGTGNGAGNQTFGFPRFATAGFSTRFPFGIVSLADPKLPVTATITGWSPFVPGDSRTACLPVAGIEYCLKNVSDTPVEVVWSYHAMNFMKVEREPGSVRQVAGGFVLEQAATEGHPEHEGALCAAVGEPDAAADCAWFRGGWFDARTVLWRRIESGEAVGGAHDGGQPSPGASIYVPLRLAPGEARTVRLRLAWYVPRSMNRIGDAKEDQAAGFCCACSAAKDVPRYVPWYAGQYDSVDEVAAAWAADYESLRARTAAFTDTLYASTLPPEILEAVGCNLTILKSPTMLRQADGRLWCWEGCCDSNGCCYGSCTHVWNYAQAVAHLFPDLERSLRLTEFTDSQDERGHQRFRAALPIRPIEDHSGHAASDGQLGGIMKIHREWRIGGDTEWLRGLWPRVKQSLDYCIATWDPQGLGVLIEPHHNTYDIEFWGPDGMCSSFYLGALKAASLMAAALGDDPTRYRALYEAGREYLETKLFDGEYFFQDVQWRELRAARGNDDKWKAGYSPEALAVLEAEGPKYQYGTGCLADGVLGAWIAEVCGVGEILDPEKVASHLSAVHRYNLLHDLSDHVNPQRPGFAMGGEGGLLLCSWPKGGQLTLPFVYSNEVWTGIEYQVAAHLITMGAVDEGCEIVRVARQRYDGRVRNPFNEYECGHWYARALASYGLLQALTGARYDAVDKVLHLEPRLDGDWQCFLATATGFGMVGIRAGEPFCDVVAGTIPVDRIAYAGS